MEEIIMFASKSERKVRYSIRKFSIGVASVVVASLFLGGVVHAEVVGGVQGDAPSAGQGKQPGVSNPGDSKPVPPETSGETKPKDSNDSTTTLEKELKEAKETAKTTLDNYRKSRLTKLNPAAFWFGDLLGESKESVEKYKRMFDEASSKEEVEALMEKSKQEIDKLIVTHQNREIDLERNKAKEAVTKHLAKLLNDIKKNLKKEQHINTVELIKKLENIKQTYLHKLDGLTQTDQLQELVIESQSKLDEALSNFKKGLSSSSNSGSSTKPETPEKSEQPKPSKPAAKEQNPSDSATGRHSGSTSSSGSSSASTKPKSPEKEQEVEPSTPSKPSGNETNSSSPTRSNSLSPTLSSQPTSPVQKVFTTQNGNTKITVMFETATEADSVNLKEVTTKEMIDNVTHQTGQGTVRIFDISLSKDGKETHVKGERVVRLAIGNIDSEIQVYHVKENGELELLPSTVENGQVVFKTSHFSLFAIKTLPKKQMVAEPEANREGKTQSDDKEMVLLADKANQMSENRSNSDKKDKQALPSTGTMSTLLMEFLGLISLVGVYLLKGKKTEND
ncbi:RICH domain-containing protein [Streptococcus pneumoniae]|nr:RICH domain-containing protein [Streptococcus pneumoniae]MDS5265591.1 RICH domain-containing protein [Streptococcus pneumoniae]MDS5302812.1 RICH domain-containing protein [Streptococcus pneumoniae]MDS5394084.1 RICH domain-containing protein [Streptococcus pneumoniae]MDS5406494.1 RICH domain-containing protein [Streptococcus pneumoniae]